MRTGVAVLGMLAGLGFSGPAAAGVSPPSPLVTYQGAPHVRKVFSQTFTLGAFKAHMGSTPLSDLARQFGGKIETLPGELNWLCYDLPNSRQRVWFSSDESQQGFVDTVTIAPAKGSECKALPASYARLVIDQDVRLGMSRAELIKRLGPPSSEVHGWLVYASRQLHDHGSNSLGLVVRFENDQAVFITASHIVND